MRDAFRRSEVDADAGFSQLSFEFIARRFDVATIGRIVRRSARIPVVRRRVERSRGSIAAGDRASAEGIAPHSSVHHVFTRATPLSTNKMGVPKTLLLATTLAVALSGLSGCMALSTRDDTILDENGNPVIFQGANWFGFNNGATMVRGL